MLRLDAGYPPLWCTPTSLQLGADPSLRVVEPARWQQRLLDELARGVPEESLEPVARALGAPPDFAGPFVAGIRRAWDSPQRVMPAAVAVRVGAGLSRSGVDALVEAIRVFGADVEVADCEDVMHGVVPPGRPIVLVAGHLVDPRFGAALMRGDITHLPVVIHPRHVVVGPDVRPGETACLACIDAHRRDRDPTWPLVAAQLLGRRAAAFDAPLGLEAGAAAARLLGDPPGPAGLAVTISADSTRRHWRAWRPHAQCRCRSLGGTAI